MSISKLCQRIAAALRRLWSAVALGAEWDICVLSWTSSLSMGKMTFSSLDTFQLANHCAPGHAGVRQPGHPGACPRGRGNC